MPLSIGRYLARLLLIRTGVLLLGLASLMMIVEFLADGDQVIAASDGVVWPLLLYTGLRLPDIVAQLMPITALLGTLLTIVELGRHNELTAIVAAGVSKLQLVRAALPVALLLGVFQLAIEDQVVPVAARELRAWGVGDYNPTGTDAVVTWVRDGRDIVRIRSTSPAGDVLTGVTIFHRDTEGNLIEQIEAERATYEDSIWHLWNLTRVLIDRQGTHQLDHELWQSALDPESLAAVVAHPRATPALELFRLIARPGFGTQPTYRYEVWLNERFASALTTLVLVLLTVALAQPRTGRAAQGTVIVVGLALGFSLWTFDGLVLTFGDLGLVPPVLAAWTPVVVILMVALTIVVHGERQGRARPATGRGRLWSAPQTAR